MPKRLVKGAFGSLPAMQVGNRYAGDEGRRHRCKNLEPITEYHDQIGPQFVQSIGTTDQPQAHGFGYAGGGIRRHQHLDARGDGQAVGF